MGKKKTGDLKIAPDEVATSSAPASVFETLFGNVGVESAAGVSIFSSDNPFRRKDSDSISAAATVNRSPNDGSDDQNVDDIKSRKKGKEKKLGSPEEDVRSSSDIKKSKRKDKSRDHELDIGATKKDDEESGFERQGGLKKNKKKGNVSSSETLEMIPGFSGELKVNLQKTENEDVKLMKEKKKKRKRDEIEREYEVKKYGATEVAEVEVEGSGGNVVGKKRKSLDDPSEMLVTKEGFDDESKLLRTVFVGNLPLKVKKKALGKEFGQYGEIESVRIRSVPLANVSFVIYIFIILNFSFMGLCSIYQSSTLRLLYSFSEQSKKPRKGAILSKKVNESADR